MFGDEMLVQMITRAAAVRHFGDWPEVLTNYARCLEIVEPRLTAEEIEGFLNVGADFYRALARAEAYRTNSVRPDGSAEPPPV